MANKGLFYISSREYIKGVGWSTWSNQPYDGEFYADITEAEDAIGKIGEHDGIELKVSHVGSYPFVNFK